MELAVSSRNGARRTKRRSVWSGVSLSCAGHWPPKHTVDGGYIHRTSTGFPDRFIPFEGRFVGGCSCRVSAFHWAGRTSFQQPVHHWRLSNSNRGAVYKIFIFQLLKQKALLILSELWKAEQGQNPQNHRSGPIVGTADSSGFPVLPAKCA